ncbi:hypothetical protein CJU89_4826 [Yarrowia sp. B02]|nr:hypothetical protein CJU89_4826 [Yarrowia sp. B02]
MDSPREDGRRSFDLIRRYNKLVDERHRLLGDIKDCDTHTEKLLVHLKHSTRLRHGAERETLRQVNKMAKKRTTKPLPPLAFSSPSPVPSLEPSAHERRVSIPIEIPDAKTVGRLESEVDRLHQALQSRLISNNYLYKEYTLYQSYDPREVLLKFYNVSDASNVQPHYISCHKDTTVDKIVSKLPPDWNVSMSSKFASVEHLCAFNKTAGSLTDLPGWISYLELGGMVFVSNVVTTSPGGIPSPPLETKPEGRGCKKRTHEEIAEMDGMEEPPHSTGLKKKKLEKQEIPSKAL